MLPEGAPGARPGRERTVRVESSRTVSRRLRQHRYSCTAALAGPFPGRRRGAAGMRATMKSLPAGAAVLFASLLGVPAPGQSAAALPHDAVRRFLAEYADFACSVYGGAHDGAALLERRIVELGERPDEERLAAARTAWLAAREVYGRSEVLRFWGGPIDDRDDGRETFINAWPIDESYIDAVPGSPARGLILDVERFPVLDAQVLRVANERGGETNVCLGWHAIEFMLWGQDRDPAGPGRRSARDFEPGAVEGAARRVEYLRVACRALQEDLAHVRDAWAPGRDNFRRRFLAQEPADALRDALRGMVVLSGFELAGERLAVAWETRDQEQEHSCFSDNTHRDFVTNQQGILALWRGDGAALPGGGMRQLALHADPELAQELDARLAASLAAIEAMPVPFDQAILGEDDAPGRRAVLAAIESLEAQTDLLAALGLRLGWVIPIRPGT